MWSPFKEEKKTFKRGPKAPKQSPKPKHKGEAKGKKVITPKRSSGKPIRNNWKQGNSL